MMHGSDNRIRRWFAGGPPWPFYVAAICITLCEFAVAVWLPVDGVQEVLGILFLPGIAILAAHGGVAAGVLALLLAFASEAFLLSGGRWIELSAGKSSQMVVVCAAMGVIVLLVGSLLKSAAQASK
jgi:K+-sensing histidine kinase KdpD